MSECAHVSQLYVSGQCVHLALQFVCVYVCVTTSLLLLLLLLLLILLLLLLLMPHPPHPLSSVLLSILSPQLIQKLEGEKSDPLQSKAQVLRQTCKIHINTFCYTETWVSPS